MQTQTWVFVSHSSADLKQVRRVRNYIEEQGAAPLLFHMRSLYKPDDFWPLIKQEIAERNFFLYCDSHSARNSEWVIRERSEVDAVRRTRPIRIGRINVDNEELDFNVLSEFIRNINVYISYTRDNNEIVRPFYDQLVASGFRVAAMELSMPWDQIDASGVEFFNFDSFIQHEVESVAEMGNGWLLSFLSADYVRKFSDEGSFLKIEFEKMKSYGHKFVPIVLDREILSGPIGSYIVGVDYLDASIDLETAPMRLAIQLLTR